MVTFRAYWRALRVSRHVHHLWAGRQKVLRAAEGVGYLFEAIPSGVIGWQDDHVGGFDPGSWLRGAGSACGRPLAP